MAHELVDAEHELLEDAQPRLDGAQLGPEFNVTGHLCSVSIFVSTPRLHITLHLLEQNFGGDRLLFSEFKKRVMCNVVTSFAQYNSSTTPDNCT